MLHIGCHLSSSDGYLAMGREALRIGADTFAFFTRNPRGGAAKPIDPADVAAFRRLSAEHNFAPLVAHAPYTLNPCAAKLETLEFARQTMREDLARMEQTPGQYYNFHPGSHVGQGAERGIALTAQTLNLSMQDEMTTTVLIETMAGKGTEIGVNFAQVRAILDRCEYPRHMGVCLDTCHVFDGGYDIAASLDDVLREFDRVIGIDRLRAVHLNDSMYGFASHKDRHAKIGEGKIGFPALSAVTNHPMLYTLPFILETPQSDNDGYADEIMRLRAAYTH